MVQDLTGLFTKSDNDTAVRLPKETSAKFTLKIDDLAIAYLSCTEGLWIFKYSEEFNNQEHTYRYISGFPDLEKTYTSTVLWPFFRIRIPGLGQPAIQEILEKENIDKTNEAALLWRFGYRTIANPYILIAHPEALRYAPSNFIFL